MTAAKLERLKEIISSYRSTLVAFSGGIDSALVLKIARGVLGRQRAKAATAKSDSLAARELAAAEQLARELDVEHRVIRTREFENPNYTRNPVNRCYFCKSELYSRLIPVAQKWNLETISSGTNVDDLDDFRPGIQAGREHGIKSPLVEAGLRKDEIRELARRIGLSVWEKPASPCLSSRVPHGEEVTPEKLRQIEIGENFLKDLGFHVVRLRHFGPKARVELGQDEFVRLMEAELRVRITEFIRSLGFKTVHFEPYRVRHPASQKVPRGEGIS
jgi:pyridinium-3,5-biscarboxylic acid mononucleotide sulfurtransferase